MIKISIKNFCRIFLLSSALFLASCMQNNADGPAFRIVGLNGERRQLQTRTPELNARILETQGHSAFQQEIPQSQMMAQSHQVSALPNLNNNVGVAGSDAMQDTLQSEPSKPMYNIAKNEVEQAAPAPAKLGDSVTSAGIAEKDQEIEYDLAAADKLEKKSPKKMRLKVGKQAMQEDELGKESGVEVSVEEVAAITKKQKGIFVQTGSFASEENAKHDLAKVQKFSKGRIEEVKLGNKTIYKVVLGPFSNDAKAKDVLRKIKSSGHDAIIVKNK